MPDKKPWGSKEMKALLTRIQMPEPNKAMSAVMALDFASREDDGAREVTIAAELADMHPHPEKDRIAKLILSEYDRLDRVFQPEAYAVPDPMEQADDETDSEFSDAPASSKGGDVRKEMARTIDRMAHMMNSQTSDEAREHGFAFAQSLVDSGKGGGKVAKDIVTPMLAAASKKAKKLASQSLDSLQTDETTQSERARVAEDIANELPREMWNHPMFRQIATALPQAFLKKDKAVMERIIAAAIKTGQEVSNKEGLGIRVTRDLVLKDFLSAQQRAEMQSWDTDSDTDSSGSDSDYDTDSESGFGDGQDSRAGLLSAEELKEQRKEAYKAILERAQAADQDGAKRMLSSFASSLSEQGVDKKVVQTMVTPMLADIMKVAETQAAPEDGGTDTPIQLSDVKKVDFKHVANVYGFGEDDAPALEELTRSIAKKGLGNAGIEKSAKDLLSASKKKKNAPKAKNGKHLLFGMYDAVRRAMGKKKVTKPVKMSEENA